MSITKHHLNASNLEAPDPFIRASEVIRTMKPNAYFQMLHRRIPYPLLDFCDELSEKSESPLKHKVIELTNSDSNNLAKYEIIIYHSCDHEQLVEANVL